MAYVPGSLPHTTLLAAIGGVVALSVDIVLPALPVLADAFATRPERAQLTLGAFLLGLAIGILVWGPLGDRFGRRPVVLCGLVVFTIGGAITAVSPSIDAIIFARFIQGAGAAAGRVLAPAIIRDDFSGPRGAHLLSRMMMILTLGPLVAPLIGGALIETAGWRAIFVFLAAFGAVVVILAWAQLGESLRMPDRDALLPRRILANWRRFFGTRECVANAFIQTCSFGAMYAYISGSPFVLIRGFGIPTWAYGFFFASTAGLLILGNAVNSRTVRTRGVAANRRAGTFAAAGAGVLGLGLSALGLTGTLGVAATMLPVWIFICANGVIVPNTTAGVMEPHPDMAGVSAAILGVIQMSAAMIVGYAVTRFFDGTPLSMSFAMCILTLGALTIERTALAPRPVAG
ncbi:MAG: multidrug effflux MFS transporter [Alphaproteobacteria bacterium]|nr:multidrug effflux MFS transporter [Alphaproteobacteria bacterium]